MTSGQIEAAIAAWFDCAEFVDDHQRRMRNAARALLASKAAVPETVAWPHEITRGHIECLIADHQRDGQKQLKHGLNSSGSYLIRVAESFRWCLEQIDAASTAPAQSCGDAEQADEAVDTFLAEVRAELIRARTKFPGDRIMTIALAEEFGELCKAVLDESAANVRKEAVQTAVMCARVVLDGDGSVNGWRAERGLDRLVEARHE
jgi:hypothetical protein